MDGVEEKEEGEEEEGKEVEASEDHGGSRGCEDDELTDAMSTVVSFFLLCV